MPSSLQKIIDKTMPEQAAAPAKKKFPQPAPKGNQRAKGCTTSGHPTDYKPEYCQMLIDDMADGYTLTAFAGKIRVSRDTIYEWINKHSEFSDAFKTGKAARQRYWEGTLRNPEGNAAKSIFGLKNCAPDDFKDKQELGFTDKEGNDVNLLAVSIGAQIAQQMRKQKTVVSIDTEAKQIE